MLMSNHEEADTKMIIHCAYAASLGANNIVVACPDTDVLVLLVHHFTALQTEKILFLTGHDSTDTTLKCYIPVHAIHQKLTTEQLHIILPVYCLTGCDTVSGSYGHGKATAFKIVIQHSNKSQSLADLGKTNDISNDVKDACYNLVCLMYGRIQNH